MLETIFSVIPRVNREGYIFIIGFFIGSVVAGFIWHPLFWIGMILTIWCLYFFRDPIRVTPLAPQIVVSPADGEVSWVGCELPPEELELGTEEMLRISIFMDVFSVHVNRIPINSKIKKIIYKSGQFVNAKLDKASKCNERNSLILETKFGDIAMVQIAGLVARRILCWAHKDDQMSCGERFGIIRFGSRVDLYLPKTAKALVACGQKLRAGESVVATFNQALSWEDYRCD